MSEVENIRIIAENFRGFRKLDIDLSKVYFVVGDNSSGKSSILHLVNLVLSSGLDGVPSLDEELSVSRYDYFSKYFGMADVVLGFIEQDEDGVSGKIVTLKYHKKRDPSVQRCTFFNDKVAVTIKKYGKGLQKRIHNIEGKDFGLDDIKVIHKAVSGFSKVEQSTKNQGIPPNHSFALMIANGRDFIEESEIFSSTLGLNLPSVRHLAPVRGLPSRFYDFKRTLTSAGTHFAPMWQDMKSEDKNNSLDQINKFGVESELFDKIDVKRVTKSIPDSPLVVTVNKGGKEFFLNQVGVGISQVVPILVECVFAKSSDGKTVVLLQQPELHLHPVAQAAMGSYFFNLCDSNFTPIIETHSNFLVDRYRADLKSKYEEKSGSVTVSEVLFCQNSSDGNTCTHINILPTGKFENPPDEYFDFFLNELRRTMI